MAENRADLQNEIKVSYNIYVFREVRESYSVNVGTLENESNASVHMQRATPTRLV